MALLRACRARVRLAQGRGVRMRQGNGEVAVGQRRPRGLPFRFLYLFGVKQ